VVVKVYHVLSVCGAIVVLLVASRAVVHGRSRLRVVRVVARELSVKRLATRRSASWLEWQCVIVIGKPR